MNNHWSVQNLAMTMLFISLFLVIPGLYFGKKWRSQEKLLQRGLDRPMRLSIAQQFSQSIRNWDVFIPAVLVINGYILANISILLYFFG